MEPIDIGEMWLYIMAGLVIVFLWELAPTAWKALCSYFHDRKEDKENDELDIAEENHEQMLDTAEHVIDEETGHR